MCHSFIVLISITVIITVITVIIKHSLNVKYLRVEKRHQLYIVTVQNQRLPNTRVSLNHEACLYVVKFSNSHIIDRDIVKISFAKQF